MNYSDFGIEDFLLDVSFQEYCLGSNDEAVKFWTNWVNEHSEKLAEIKTARSLYFNLNGNITDKDFQADYKVFENAFEQVIAADLKITRLRQRFPVKSKSLKYRAIITLSAVAASVLLVTGFYFLSDTFHSPRQELTAKSPMYYSPAGKKTHLTLSDGTQVILNGSSTLTVLKDYGRHQREVILDGEGYFTVFHNDKIPFIVHTRKIDVRDIGTTFNIKAYQSDRTVEASLIKGSIAISFVDTDIKKTKEIILVPNQKYVLLNHDNMMPDKGTINGGVYKISHLTSVLPGVQSFAETDWTQDKLTLYDEQFEDAALKIERWYGVKITINNEEIKKYHYTATFDQQSLEQVLTALKLSGNFNYRKEGNTVNIY